MAKPKINHVYLPDGPNDEKVGVDDFLLNHSVDELKELAGKPKPALTPQAPQVEWLEEAPPSIMQPLTYVDGHAYATTWVHVKVTKSETVNKDGDIVHHDSPIIETSKEMIVVRDDGTTFGSGCAQSIDDLNPEVKLDAQPRDNKLWRPNGVLNYAKGNRPEAADVFRRIASVYDRFLDFSRSISDQSRMCELSACFSMITWFRPVFIVLGYLWPNGDKGSGKTKYALIWALTSYLGEMILASTTLSVLRDMAEYGGAMVFDDAENLADPKKSDPHKRALLLAGNRVGATIGIKEISPDGKKWITRHYNAFCPRAFTAINIPDPVLASRSVIIPLVRTNNPYKSNADPMSSRTWPCDQRELQDDLWALALSLMAEAGEIWNELDDEADVVGREFEPWRAIIAIARLFQRHGVDGLEDRMREVMTAYQKEKTDLVFGDRTAQIIKALLAVAGIDPAMDTKDALDALDTKSV